MTAGALVGADALDFVELFLRNQSSWDALFCFDNESVAIVFAGDMGFPRGVMALMPGPLDISAMDGSVHLITPTFFVTVPPTKLNAHGYGLRETSELGERKLRNRCSRVKFASSPFYGADRQPAWAEIGGDTAEC